MIAIKLLMEIKASFSEECSPIYNKNKKVQAGKHRSLVQNIRINKLLCYTKILTQH